MKLIRSVWFHFIKGDSFLSYVSSLVLWTSNGPAPMNTFETSGVKISHMDVNGPYMCLSSLTIHWEQVSLLRWKMSSDSPTELFM